MGLACEWRGQQRALLQRLLARVSGAAGCATCARAPAVRLVPPPVVPSHPPPAQVGRVRRLASPDDLRAAEREAAGVQGVVVMDASDWQASEVLVGGVCRLVQQLAGCKGRGSLLLQHALRRALLHLPLQACHAPSPTSPLLRCTCMQIIPAENLVAVYQQNGGATLLAATPDAASGRVMLEALEVGTDGVLLCTDSPAEVSLLGEAGRRGGRWLQDAGQAGPGGRAACSADPVHTSPTPRCERWLGTCRSGQRRAQPCSTRQLQ